MAEPFNCECGSSRQSRRERQRRESVSLTFLSVGCAHACCRPPDKPFPPTLFLEVTKARLDLWGIGVLPRVTTGPQPGFEAAKLCQGGDGQEEEAASFQQKIGIKTRREKGFTVLHLIGIWPSLAQTVRNLPTMQKTWVRSLSREDPLEEGMATHSSILAWRIPWTEEPGGL